MPDRAIFFGKALIDAGAGGRFFPGRRLLLEVVHLPEEFIGCGLLTDCCLVGNTTILQGIPEDPPADIFVLYASDLDLSVDPFKPRRRIVIRKRGYGNFKRNELGSVVGIPVKTCLQPAIGPVLQVGGQQLVPVPVEEEDTHKQYGSNTFQGSQIRKFLDNNHICGFSAFIQISYSLKLTI